MAKKKKVEQVETPEVAPNNLSDAPTIADVSKERELAYEKYQADVTPEEVTTENTSEEAVTSAEKGEAVTEELEPEKSEETEEVEEPEKAEKAEKTEKTEEVKTVPLAALHEEREKRKTAQSELREIKEQMSGLLEDNRKLMTMLEDKSTEQPSETETLGDYDEELLTLKRQNKMLLDRLDKIESATTTSKQQSEIEKNNALLMKLDENLTAEGFPGLMKFQAIVADKMRNIAETDPDRYKEIMQTRETWIEGCGEVYKEIYKDMNNMFVTQEKTKKISDKEELKSKAGLVGKTGQTISKPPEEEGEWTYKDYVKQRQKSPIFR